MSKHTGVPVRNASGQAVSAVLEIEVNYRGRGYGLRIPDKLIEIACREE